MKFNDTLNEAIKLDLQVGLTPALMGEPGIGKSSFVEDLARQMNTQAFVLACNQLTDKADLTGARLLPTADGKSYQQVFFPHHIVQEAVEYALANPNENPILLLDEINRTNPDVTSAALTMETLRRLGSVILPKNLRMMVAGNNKGNVTTLDEASLSRFSIYHVEPDATTFLALMGDTCNQHIKNVLNKRPDLIFAKPQGEGLVTDGTDDDDDAQNSYVELFDADEEMNQITTPRTIERLSRWLNVADINKLASYLATPTEIKGSGPKGNRVENVLREILEGHIGNTEFTTLLIASISEEINSGASGSTSTRQVTRPTIYANLKAVTTISDLDDLMGTMTENDLSGSLLFALYEKEDNARLIEHLAPKISTMGKEHLKELATLASSSQLSSSNVTALVETRSSIAQQLDMLLAMV